MQNQNEHKSIWIASDFNRLQWSATMKNALTIIPKQAQFRNEIEINRTGNNAKTHDWWWLQWSQAIQNDLHPRMISIWPTAKYFIQKKVIEMIAPLRFVWSNGKLDFFKIESSVHLQKWLKIVSDSRTANRCRPNKYLYTW